MLYFYRRKAKRYRSFIYLIGPISCVLFVCSRQRSWVNIFPSVQKKAVTSDQEREVTSEILKTNEYSENEPVLTRMKKEKYNPGEEFT